MHVPSTMDQQFLTNILSLVYAVVATVNAGVSATNTRIDSDRDREVSTGRHVGGINFHLQMEPDVGAKGTIEYVIFKVERSFVTPVVGTDPIPSSAEVDSQGIQQAFRLNMPGWVMKFGTFGVTAELPISRNIFVSPAKFRKSKINDGDHIGIALFNRTVGTVNFSVQMRYKEYTG